MAHATAPIITHRKRLQKNGGNSTKSKHKDAVYSVMCPSCPMTLILYRYGTNMNVGFHQRFATCKNGHKFELC